MSSDEILKGIACCYPVIYAPHLRAVSKEVIESLTVYVQKGGRLIADVQFAFCDEWGKLHEKGKGSQIENLFGAWVDTIHDSRTGDRKINNFSVEGFYGDIVCTDAKILNCFENGATAITENTLGEGSAVLIGFDAAMSCQSTIKPQVEELLECLINSDDRNEWNCSAPMTFRIECESADHYFIINNGVGKAVYLNVFDNKYNSGLDVIENQSISTKGTIVIDVEKESGAWIRLCKV